MHLIQARESSHIASEADWRLVDPDTLPADWPKYRPLVRRFLDQGEGVYTERDILAFLLAGRWVLAACGSHLPKAIGVVEVANYPLRRVLVLRYAAGDKDAILAGEQWLCDEARKAGCQAIESHARRGWERLAKDWKRVRVVLRKDLE